ncbi:hypothetical protein [Desulfopila aestuarii]|uniref:Uncharacterized protein n=1 Tax=Desulfopila aestuarii DSM 18488 TaxID=1121416 RepID=A0A1M7YFE9_9BACT|nr:hypothetical protein [Desulfopila aestuarii]SHO51362.1 hypothetical protein SAMN02745220_03979 [Desulfopila aestuarii DSM 18488]
MFNFKKIPLLVMCISLGFGGLSFAEKLKQPTQDEIAVTVIIDDTMKSLFKSGVNIGLSPDTVRQAAAKEVRDALEVLKGNKAALAEFAKRLKTMANSGKSELGELIKGNRLKTFAVAVMDESGSSAFRGINADGLKKLVGYGADGLDSAGVKALDILNQIEDVITRTGEVPAKLANDLKTALKQLSPEQARAARQLLAEKGARGVVKDYLTNNPTVLGSFVDGVFVLAFDVPNLIALSDAEEKAASATGVGFGYVAQATGTAAVASLGGGFLPGLVVSWSSAQVKELVTEIIMLQYDLENAAMKDQWADMELRMDVIKGMLKVDELIKTGQLQKAEDYLSKVERFTYGKKIPNEGLYEKIHELEKNIVQAKEQLHANRIIAEARIPYMQGYRLADQGRNLIQAKNLVGDALVILQEAQGQYPELHARVQQAQALLAFIEKMIAEAPPLGEANVTGPDKVKPGEEVQYEVTLQGGIPDYTPVGMNGLGLTTGALFYWQAPMGLGSQTLIFQVQDNLGKIAEVQKKVEIEADTASEELTGDIWEIMKDTPNLEISFKKGYGATRATVKATISPGTEISFPVNYQENGFRYEGTGILHFSTDGATIQQLSLDLQIISGEYGLMAKEEIRIGPFREVSLDPAHNLGSNLKYSKKNGLRYVYALGDREKRGTYHYGEVEFHSDGKDMTKSELKWKEVENVEFDGGTNTWNMLEQVQINFQMAQ